MNKEPLVSIIMPTYNRARLVGRAVDSVLAQTYRNFEFIIVDDASTDETAQVIASIADDRIRFFRNDARRGAAFSRNVGIRAATGQYIGFQDSDDEWNPDKLARQMAALANTPADVGVAYTGFWKELAGKRTYIPSRRIAVREGNIHQALLWENFLGTPALLVKRNCLQAVGLFAEELLRFQDWELCLRLSVSYKFVFIDEPLFTAYYNDDNISKDDAAALHALSMIFAKFNQEIVSDRKLLAHYQHWLALCCATLGMKTEACRFLWQAVWSNPLNGKYYVSALVGIISPKALMRLVVAFQRYKNIQSIRATG